MSSDNLAISVSGLSKAYTISHNASQATTLAEAAVRWVKGLGRSAPKETFWAVRDVSFEVRPGEVVGIIGRNGAGKSTLLKILSQVTEPTDGQIDVYGRVGSLLEVGTGFHPELTGRENVFLNGAILGMRRSEIRKQFDEIVAFAEVEKFLDTPVKHYSSGMYVRLAFAVAAHLEPEILLVDEVLAVGDAKFQQKCITKMENVASQGRTVLFVSHRTASVQTLCTRAIWVNDGKIKEDGDCAAVLNKYLANLACGDGDGPVLKSVCGSLEIERVVTKSEDGKINSAFRSGSSLTVEITYNAKRPVALPYLWVGISGYLGPITIANMALDGIRPERLEGRGMLSCTFAELALMPQQTYILRMGGHEQDGHTLLFKKSDVAQFHVVGDAHELGFEGEPAARFLPASPPVLSAYTWEFADGRSASVDFRSSKQKRPSSAADFSPALLS